MNWREQFENGEVYISIDEEPVSAQNKQDKKKHFKQNIQNTISSCPYLITNHCWIEIDYYCKHIRRLKNPGVYDLDNIVKPILDSLWGEKGIVIDDIVFDRVDVNWIDNNGEDHIEINLKYPDLFYIEKDRLVIYKNRSNWCWPSFLTGEKQIDNNLKKIANDYFKIWNKISTEDDYYKYMSMLPIQRFIYYSKLKDKNYNIIDIE